MKYDTVALVLAACVIALATGCETTPTQQGAVVGGALGAGTGAIIGHQHGKQGEGALIGAAAGALAGALVGDRIDENRDRYNGPRYGQTQSPPPPPPTQQGHWETRTIVTQSGETYEERVWVPDPPR